MPEQEGQDILGLGGNPDHAPVIIYHADCKDGIAAAWVARTALHENEGSVHLHAATYGSPPPWRLIAGNVVWCVDFTYPVCDLVHMVKQCSKVVVLDHHITAIRDIEEHDPTFASQHGWVLDTNHSGAVLTWKYFHPNESPPALLRYIEDRDLWKWELPESKAVDAFLRSFKVSPNTSMLDHLSLIVEDDLPRCVAEGDAILRMEGLSIDSILAQATVVRFAGYEVLGVSTPIFQSEVAGKLSEQGLFGLTWTIRDHALVIQLRSCGDTHVGELAHQCILNLGGGYGGGHKNAAGVTIPINELALVLSVCEGLLGR